jgi:hypothetical protein
MALPPSTVHTRTTVSKGSGGGVFRGEERGGGLFREVSGILRHEAETCLRPRLLRFRAAKRVSVPKSKDGRPRTYRSIYRSL